MEGRRLEELAEICPFLLQYRLCNGLDTIVGAPGGEVAAVAAHAGGLGATRTIGLTPVVGDCQGLTAVPAVSSNLIVHGVSSAAPGGRSLASASGFPEFTTSSAAYAQIALESSPDRPWLKTDAST